MRKLSWSILLILASIQSTFASEKPDIDTASLLHTERYHGVPMDIMRYNDLMLYRSAYGSGGDLFSQFVRFLFPISGREKRTMFMPISYWDTKKPRYHLIKWKRFESDHFDFYAYPESQQTLQTVIKYYEEEYDRNNRVFGVDSKFTKKIPIIYYQTRRDFEQTAIVDGPIPEGLGGLTEIFSWRRVTFPFEGELSKFEHVGKHEGTHVFQIAKKAKKLPLWFVEGSAETNSIYWDSDAEMIIRDAFLNGFFLHIPDLWQIQGTWLMYKIGNYICNVIWDEFGEDGFKKIYEASSTKSFESNLEESLGITLEELDRKVHSTLLERYSYLLHRKDVLSISKKITDGHVLLASHDRYFITGGTEGPRNALYINYMSPDGTVTKKRFSLDKTFENESFENFQKGASLTQEFIVYSVKKSAYDELRIVPFRFNGREKEFTLSEERRHFWKGIDRIQNAILIGDAKVAFIGYQDGFSNIYIADLTKPGLEKITNDNAHYTDLDYSPTRDQLVFSREGERDPKKIFYNRDLFLLDVKTRHITQLTKSLKIIDIQPQFSPDGKSLLYISTPNFTYDLMMMDLETKEETKLTTMNVGAKNPQWFSNGSILFNGYKVGVPSVYQFTIPDAKKLLQMNKPNFQKSKFVLKDGQVTVSTKAEVEKISEELVLDGFYIREKKPVIRHQNRNYTAESISMMDHKLIMKTNEGLPGDKQTKHETLPHYFEMEGKEIRSLKSTMVADDGISDDIKKWAELKLNGRDIVQSWMSQDHKKALLIINNRLAKNYDTFLKKPQVSVVVYDEASNHVEELEKAPIRSLDQVVQWVAFLKNDQIFIAVGEQRTGPFEVYIYNQKTKTYRLLDHEIQQFRISKDFSRVSWKGTAHLMADFSSADGYTVTELKDAPEKVMAFDFNQDNQPIFFSFAAKDKKWIYSTYIPEEKKYVKKEIPRKEDEVMQRAVISNNGYVAILISTREKKKFEQLWVWNINGESMKLNVDGDVFSALVFRKDFLTFTASFHDSSPSREYVWSPILGINPIAFDEVQSTQYRNNRLVFEGQNVLGQYEQNSSSASVIDRNTFGYTWDGNKVTYSSRPNKYFQISQYNLDNKTSKPLTQTLTDKITPIFQKEDLSYITTSDGHWSVETMDESGKTQTVTSPNYEFTDIEKKNDETIVEGQNKQTNRPAGADHPYQPEYQTILQPQPVRHRLRLQNLAAAAAYDGDSIRYFFSGFADNLFSDRGVYVNSMFLGDTKFATIGFSDLNSGFNNSFFYNFRSGIENMGLDFSKNFIFDRYRQLTPYVDFEYQSYTSDSSAINSFINSNFDSKSFYLVKFGAIYSYDVTVWDRHGPSSGSRLYFRTETGIDASNARSSNTDGNVDLRIYNRVLPKFGFAHRFSAGTSQGPIPNIYLVGGNMSFRGVGFDDLVGQNYWVFSEDIRLPIFDFVGAKFFDPLDYVLGFFTRYFDVRAGIYGDVGATWMNGQDPDTIYSVGYFVNIPTAFGLIVRLNQGFLGEKKFGLWFGTNW